MIISLDTEYSELDIKKAELLSVSIGTADAEYLYTPDQLDQVQSFTSKATSILVQNGVVDWYMLKKSGVLTDKNKYVDCMLLEHLIDENLEHGLDNMALRYYNDNYKGDFWDNPKKGHYGPYKAFQDAPREVQEIYERKDARYTYDLGMKFLNQLRGKELLIQHVHKLNWALFDTEIRGLKVNKDLMIHTKDTMSKQIEGYLSVLKEEYSEYANLWEMEKWREKIKSLKSERGKLNAKKPEFSFTSDKQISWLVYEAMECPVITKTKKGNPSTDYDTLKTLSQDYPSLKTIVDYKEIKAVYSTFVEGMLDRVEGDRIYPTFYVNGTKTGRLSHANPNMGNLPTEGVIRNFFIPDEGKRIIGADYSMLEVVVEANLTNDKSLLKIILEGASKHDITAQGLGIPRDQAKTLNFALQYGAGVHKISKILGISVNDAQDVFNRYWDLYSGCKALKEETCKALERDGCVTNLFGRTRHFDRPTNKFEKARQERQAVNFMVQGVGADMTNMATYRIADRLKREGLGELMFSVHDEILAQVKTELTEQGKIAILQEMRGVNDYLNFKYHVDAKSYGPLECWSKT